MRFAHGQRVPVSAIRIDRPGREALEATAFAIAFVAAAWGTGLLVRAHPVPTLGAGSFTQDLWHAGLFKGVALGVLLPLVTVAIPEEVVCRGILQTRLERTAGRTAAIVLSVAFFTA